MKGVFVGSGSDGLNIPEVCDSIIKLTGKDASSVRVIYLGTATYDLPGPMQKQTERFSDAGCCVEVLNVASAKDSVDYARMEEIFEACDIVIVSGGNTLYAVDRWIELGIDKLLRKGADRGMVITGGSAGAICWFEGGHSDSADTDTYKNAMLDAAAAVSETGGVITEDNLQATGADAAPSPWQYIRVDGLGFLPGLLCPHHDKVQSNGIPRSQDMDAMLLRHRGERGICIDHYAALVVDSDQYRVISLEGREGSVVTGEDGTAIFSADRKGVPGIWTKDVTENGLIQVRLVAESGPLSGLLTPAVSIVKDPKVEDCRRENPTPLYRSN